MKTKKIIQWGIAGLLTGWGFGSFLVFIGEDSPAAPLSFGQFVLLKAAALASLALCYHAGKKLHAAGYLPEVLTDSTIWEND